MTDDADANTDADPAGADPHPGPAAAPNTTSGPALLAGLSEVELSALVAVCVAAGVAVWSSPAPVETRLPMLVVSVAVTAGVFLTAVPYLR